MAVKRSIPMNNIGPSKKFALLGSEVAEWSTALFERENKRKLKDPRFAPRPLEILKKICFAIRGFEKWQCYSFGYLLLTFGIKMPTLFLMALKDVIVYG